MKSEVIVKTARVYNIRRNGEWATLTIDEWDGGGSFQCTSSFGNYNYVWGATGTSTLREFLCGLDYGYFFCKTSDNTKNGQRFSNEKTVKVIKEAILDSRRKNEITNIEAREYITELNEFLEIGSESEFYSELIRTELFDEFYGGDYCSMPRQYEDDSQCSGFWNTLWQDMCEYWKNELSMEAV